MNPLQYHAITSRGLSILNPLSPKRLDDFLALIELPSHARVLDMGCGKGEMLIRLAERFAIQGVGVDISPDFLAQAERETAHRVSSPARLLFLAERGEQYRPDAPFHMVICLGASWIYGGYEQTLLTLKQFLLPEGLLLMGERHWEAKPPPRYLEAAGLSEQVWGTHDEQVQVGPIHGLTPLYAQISTRAEWEYYEWMRVRAAELHAKQNPEYPGNETLLLRARRTRDRYLRWARHCVGWALYLFMKD